MKLTNEDAKVIWFVFGKLTLGWSIRDSHNVRCRS